MKHPNSTACIGPLGSTRNQKVVAKHYAPPRTDLSDVEIPHRNSSMTETYKPNDRTVYRPGSQVRHPSRGIRA